MTDAEKMREAAAQACDRIAGNTADFGRDYRRAAGQCAAMIRVLPIPVDASAPNPELAELMRQAEDAEAFELSELFGGVTVDGKHYVPADAFMELLDDMGKWKARPAPGSPEIDQACKTLSGLIYDAGEGCTIDERAGHHALEMLKSVLRKPPVEASAPAADCQQAGLVTVDAALLDEVKAALRSLSTAYPRIDISADDFLREFVRPKARAALARLEQTRSPKRGETK